MLDSKQEDMLNISITSLPMQANRLLAAGKPACRTALQVGLTFLNIKLIKGLYEKIERNSQPERKWILHHPL